MRTKLFLLIALLLLTIPFKALADVSGRGQVADSFTIGGRTLTGSSLANMIVLYGALVTSAATKHTTLRKMNGAAAVSAGYQVTAGKVLTIWGCKYVISAAAAVSLVIGYGDTDVGANSAAAPTSEAGFTGQGTTAIAVLSPVSTVMQETPVTVSIPAAKYPEIVNNGGTVTAEVYCYGTEK